jgi:hypothetical protein
VHEINLVWNTLARFGGERLKSEFAGEPLDL